MRKWPTPREKDFFATELYKNPNDADILVTNNWKLERKVYECLELNTTMKQEQIKTKQLAIQKIHIVGTSITWLLL